MTGNRLSGAGWRAVALSSSALALALHVYVGHVLSARPALQAVQAAPAPKTRAVTAPLLVHTVRQVSELADARNPAALEALFAIAGSHRSGLVHAALDGIARIGGDRARQFLIARLSQVSDGELSELTAALATLGDEPAREALRAAARSPRVALRVSAFGALSNLDTPDVRDFMVRALSEPDPYPAIGYFLDLHDPRALPALEGLAQNASAELSRQAIDALLAQGPSSEPAILGLLQKDSELFDRLLASPPHTLAALAAVRSASVARMRAGAVSGGPLFDFMEQDLSRETRDALIFAAHDPATTYAAVFALAGRADSASLSALAQLANDSDPELAAQAVCALVSDPDSRSRVPLQRTTRGTARAHAAHALLVINAPGARPI